MTRIDYYDQRGKSGETGLLPSSQR